MSIRYEVLPSRRVEPDPTFPAYFEWAVLDTNYGPEIVVRYKGLYAAFGWSSLADEYGNGFAVTPERVMLWSSLFAKPDK